MCCMVRWRRDAFFPVRFSILSHLCASLSKVHPRIMPLLTADGEDRQGRICKRTGGQNGNKLIIIFAECYFGFDRHLLQSHCWKAAGKRSHLRVSSVLFAQHFMCNLKKASVLTPLIYIIYLFNNQIHFNKAKKMYLCMCCFCLLL